MKDFYDFTPVEEALLSAQSFVVVLPTDLNADKVAAALSLYLSLKKAGKQVEIVCAVPMTVEYSSLVGVDKIHQKMGGRNLMISFVGYNEDSIEKVSYQSEDNQFNLVIQPKEGVSSITSDKIKYSYFGSKFDLILTVGAYSWSSLGELYSHNQESFEQGQSLNLDVSPQNQQFAKINFVKNEMTSLSELVTLLLSSLNFPFDEDMASNLLLGMKKATFNFSLEKASVSTFEAVALCLRAGGRRPFHEPLPQRKIESRKQKIGLQPQRQPSPDWYKPKIYKGDTKI